MWGIRDAATAAEAPLIGMPELELSWACASSWAPRVVSGGGDGAYNVVRAASNISAPRLGALMKASPVDWSPKRRRCACGSSEDSSPISEFGCGGDDPPAVDRLRERLTAAHDELYMARILPPDGFGASDRLSFLYSSETAVSQEDTVCAVPAVAPPLSVCVACAFPIRRSCDGHCEAKSDKRAGAACFSLVLPLRGMPDMYKIGTRALYLYGVYR